MKYIFKTVALLCLVTGNISIVNAGNERNIYIKLRPQQINVKNNLFINNMKRADCSDCFARELFECMKSLSVLEFQESFKKLNSEARKQLLLSMNIRDYEAMLACFSDEEWATTVQALSSENNEYLPRTKAEQMEILVDVYFEFYQEVCKGKTQREEANIKDNIRLLKERCKKMNAPERAKFFYLNQVFQEKKELLFKINGGVF